MKKLCGFVLILVMLMTLAACDEKDSIVDKTNSIPATTISAESTDALSELRHQMKPPIIAVADFGFPVLSEEFGVMDYLLDEYPGWMKSHDFIGDIPEERIIFTCGYDDWGELMCIVPKDPASTVSVHITRYMDTEPYLELGTEVVYHSEKGEPILLLADTADYLTVSVVVTDSQGRGVCWYPTWDSHTAIPESAYSGNLVMDFTPPIEYATYEDYLEFGWYAPGPMDLDRTGWESEIGYSLEFYYEPGEQFDGYANLYGIAEDGYSELIYSGNWVIVGGNLLLDLVHVSDETDRIEGSFPILMEPEYDTGLWIDQDESGVRLPFHWTESAGSELKRMNTAEEDSDYDVCKEDGWYVPEFYELMETFWLSDYGYALELMENDVSEDNGGLARIYDVGSNGEYTLSYSGTWMYENGYIHFLLVPIHDDGYFVDDSFPVLMDPNVVGRLFIGRNENGIGLPHFPPYLQGDKVEQPKG